MLLLFFYNDIPKSLIKYYQCFYTFLEYAFFSYLLWINVQNKKLKRLIIYFSIGFFLFQFIYAFRSQKSGLDSIPIGIETILILAFIFFFFYEFAQKESSNYIYNHYCFWISVGILIYLGGSFFFYILFNELSREQVVTFGNMTFVAEILKNFLFGFALIIYAKNPTNNNNIKHSNVPYLDMI